jgi:ribosome-interacting GTPase 1
MGATERILELEEELRTAQYNKATEHHFITNLLKKYLIENKAG